MGRTATLTLRSGRNLKSKTARAMLTMSQKICTDSACSGHPLGTQDGMFLKQRNPAPQRHAPAAASGTPTCSSMTRHSSVQSATCLSIVILPALGTAFSQRTAMLSALDGMGPATESRCHSNWGVRLTSCSFLNERDLTSKIVQCCTEV